MKISSEILPVLIESIIKTIEQNAEQVTVLDQTLGDGDHVTNLQRGLDALKKKSDVLFELEWSKAMHEIGMTLLSTMGGASGSLFGTLFLSMSKAIGNNTQLDQPAFAEIFSKGVQAVRKRGKADAGEKTMLDVLIPVAEKMKQEADAAFPDFLDNIRQTAIEGMESTRDMIATKGRASYMQEKSIGHIDAGARTSQLMICAIIDVLESGESP